MSLMKSHTFFPLFFLSNIRSAPFIFLFPIRCLRRIYSFFSVYTICFTFLHPSPSPSSLSQTAVGKEPPPFGLPKIHSGIRAFNRTTTAVYSAAVAEQSHFQTLGFYRYIYISWLADLDKSVQHSIYLYKEWHGSSGFGSSLIICLSTGYSITPFTLM